MAMHPWRVDFGSELLYTREPGETATGRRVSEVLPYDVVIVGAGPAGLACAISLAQAGAGSVAVLEKGGTVGAHSLSGAVMDPRGLDVLLPDWLERDAPIDTPVTRDRFALLTENHTVPLPVPPLMNNRGAFIVSLARLARWLGEQAEAAGVDILPGFAGRELLTQSDTVTGISTGEVDIHAEHTILAEGARGSLAKQAIARFDLDKGCDPQTYGLGIKEVWEIDPARHHHGEAFHSIGWPLWSRAHGGSFIYHMSKNHVVLGLVVALDYANPYLDPFAEMQRFKTHAAISKILKGGKRLEYGSRALAEGGLQSLPGLEFPGGMLVGDAAGFLNAARIKGIHAAIESGILAAETITGTESYENLFKNSALYRELHTTRNIRPGFQRGLWAGLANAGLEALTGGRTPWTLKNRADHTVLKPATACRRIAYPAPDGVLTFDRKSSVYLSGTHHAEGQACHLRLTDPSVPIAQNLPKYAEPAQRYCPAGVYEVTPDQRFQINAANCVHCKACDIKDPAQNITWVPPEGGDGPNYQDM